MNKLLKSRVFILLLILAIGWVGFSLYKVLNQKKSIDNEIAQLGKEIQKSEVINKELSEMLEYLKTDSYLEKEAKGKLSLQKPGEKVIIVNRREGLAPEEIKKVGNVIVDDEPKNNWQRWFRYFFNQ